jgi:hypothetical protein
VIETIITLALLLLLTNAFWAYQCHRLVNKLMSRNYAEYHQLTHPPDERKPFEGKIPLADVRQDLGALEGFGVG